MNYFEHFGLTPKFFIDEAALRLAFIEKSKTLHPDFYGQAEEAVRDQILELSTLNNAAYKVLRHLPSRIAYILSIYDIMPPEGEAKVPQSFLMEMMDINEMLMEMEFSDDPQEIKRQICVQVEQIDLDIFKEAESAMHKWDAGDKNRDHLFQILNYHLKSKYLMRVMEQVTE